MKISKWIIGAGFAAVAAVSSIAQTPSFTRTPVQQQDLGSLPGREVVVSRVEFVPGGAIGQHTHPGEEIGYVVEGSLELLIQGQPAKTVKAGEGFVVPAGTVHQGKAVGSGKTVVLATYVIEKGKPVATMVK